MSNKTYGSFTISDINDGVGIAKTIPYYLASSKSTGVTIDEPGWSRIVPELTPENKYLWIYYSNVNGVGDTDPVLIEQSGEMVTFENDGGEAPLDNITVEFSPKQDLNGYDRPWPPGGGKNKLEVTATTTTVDGVSFVLDPEGRIIVDGSYTGADDYYDFTVHDSFIVPAGKKYRLMGNPVPGTASTIYLGYNGYSYINSGDYLDVNRTTTTQWSGKVYIRIYKGFDADNLIFEPRFIDITDDVPDDTSFTPYSNICPIAGFSEVNVYNSPEPPHHYGAIWDRNNTKMTRTGDAADITTTTTNFKHSGSINANYNNPFDDIYPWSDVKLCNIDINAYRQLQDSDDITDCVVAWEGEAAFSYTHENGVWKYTPEFWGLSWDDEDGNRHFDICDKPCAGYIHYKPLINGRWRGVAETRTIDGASKTILLPKVGMPCTNVTLANIHTYANNFGGTLDSVFTLDGATLMYIVEYADMHSQNAVGNGASNIYRQSSDQFTSASSNSNVVHVLKANATLVIPNAIMDIGTSNGGIQVGKYYVVSTATNASDSTILDVTLDRAVTVTTSNYWSIHGIINVADEEIGSKSGYIGTNGRCDAYYRGEVLWGNMFYYVLGVYRQGHPYHHVWFANSDEEADDYNALNMNVHRDSGIRLATANGYIKKLGYPKKSFGLSAPTLCTANGGSSATPVGDYFATNATSTGNTYILIVGGSAGNGADGGLFYWYWNVTSGHSGWNYAGRPRLKTPQGV